MDILNEYYSNRGLRKSDKVLVNSSSKVLDVTWYNKIMIYSEYNNL